MTKIMILTDDGHGQETAGKRTPKFEDGTFIRENSINRKIEKIFRDLVSKDERFATCQLAPEDIDVPLPQRVIRANKIHKGNKDCIGISFHCNASTGEWGKAEGIETLFYTNSTKSRQLATYIQECLIKGTPQKNRGVIPRNDLYILKKSSMPFVLVEIGFMDNRKEVELLKDDEFLKECAKECFEGIKKYFKV